MKMKIAIILIAVFAFVTADPIDYYITDNTGLDVEALIAVPQNFKSCIDCFLDRGPCSNVGASYKKYIAEAVAQSCRRCSPDQKQLFWRFLETIKPIFPTEYENFWKKYDPEHKYFDPLMKELFKYRLYVPLPLPSIVPTIPPNVPQIQL